MTQVEVPLLADCLIVPAGTQPIGSSRRGVLNQYAADRGSRGSCADAGRMQVLQHVHRRSRTRRSAPRCG